MEDLVKINVGTLSSFNSLYRNAAPKLELVRNEVAHGRRPNIVWDFSYTQARRINMAALTAFLSMAKGVSKSFGHAIPVVMRWDPNVLRFLFDVGFFSVAEELGILAWPKELIGGLPRNKTNPHTKIIFFDQKPDLGKFMGSISLMNDWKEITREELIVNHIYGKIESLFVHENFYDNWNRHLVQLLSVTIAELIVNSLLHGQDTAFVGLQKSPKGVTVCVCDGGIGFLNSMIKNAPSMKEYGLNSNIDAVVNASLLNEHKIGLRKAIEDIILSDGYIILSSVDCEIRWQQSNWTSAKIKYDTTDGPSVKVQSAKSILGAENRDVDFVEIKDGYYRIFGSKLKGTRITFEIPSKALPI